MSEGIEGISKDELEANGVSLPAAPDPFDLDSLRIDQSLMATPAPQGPVSRKIDANPVDNPFDFSQFQAAESGGLRPVAIPVTQVDVRVPGKTEWIRVHKEVDPFPARLVYPPDAPNAQGERPPKEAHLAATQVALNPMEYDEVDLVPFVNREGGFGLWPVKRNPATSMGAAHANKNREIAKAAQDSWVKRVSKAGDLPTMEVAANQGYEPQWPSDFNQETFLTKYLGMAFPGRLITSEDHLLIKKHRGV